MPRSARELPWIEVRSGVFYVNWYCPPADPKAKGRTERLSLRTRDSGEAQARFSAFLANREGVFTPKTVNSVLDVERALHQYFTEHVATSVVDTVRQENAIRHLKVYFAGTALSDIDIPACRGYAVARRSGAIGGGARHSGDRAKGSDSTIRRELNVLQAAARHALRWKRITADRMPTFELPSEDEVDEEVMWLSKTEVQGLIAKAEGDLKLFILLAYWTGSRRAAIETLRLDQINLAMNRINLSKPGERKTKKRRPMVPVFPEFRAELEAAVAEAQAAGRQTLFRANIDFYKPFAALCKAEGLGGRDFPHILRHSRATHMLMDGESIYKVGRLLGDTVKTIEGKYGHSSVEFLEGRN